MIETYTARFILTPQVLADAVRLAQPRSRLLLLTSLVGFAAIGVFEIVVNGVWWLGALALVFGVAMSFAVWTGAYQRWSFGRIMKGVAGETHEYTATGDGLHLSGPIGISTAVWSSLTEVRADERTVILMRGKVLACYVPASAFASAAERDAFVAFCRAHVSEAASAVASGR